MQVKQKIPKSGPWIDAILGKPEFQKILKMFKIFIWLKIDGMGELYKFKISSNMAISDQIK